MPCFAICSALRISVRYLQYLKGYISLCQLTSCATIITIRTFLTCIVGYRYCESQTKSSHFAETKPRLKQATWLQMIPWTPVCLWAFICYFSVTSCNMSQLECDLIHFCLRQSVSNPKLFVSYNQKLLLSQTYDIQLPNKTLTSKSFIPIQFWHA